MTCFSAAQPEASEKVMPVLDQINGRWGRRTLKVATVLVAPDWRMKRDLLSQRYTTCMAELFIVKT
ncbi:Error-prone, lesion bypass DNA polymerase V (UmuC) [Pseudomonas synxantha]|uniref:Error-prone, lesion bypass DNA polymerase V (UmuC) n=3 Tax=Pseudomonas TaxID=286 RepID=A0A3G7TZB0_9PSED|nr:Error-prone, lesion bypass DNA polymerase V (UmuC) [Pseudomonas synxantha]